VKLAAEKKDGEPVESEAPPQQAAASDAAPTQNEALISTKWPGRQVARPLAIFFGSVIGFAIIVAGLLATKMFVPAHVASELMSETETLKSETETLKRENDELRRAGEQLNAKLEQYEKRLAEGSPEQFKAQIAELQATIQGLEQQIEAARASEWPPLNAAAQDALYNALKDLPAREVWVGYADSGGRDLAKTFSTVFTRLSWPQKYDILAVVDPQEGLWITPISDFSQDVRDRIRQSTGLEFKLFPHREQLPDAKQIGIIIGYRTPKEGSVP
jgi:hypothetical protein